MKYPTKEHWQSLFNAADRFYQNRPWEFMANELIFGVEDPVSHQIGWCCVLGDGGIEYGLCVYRGSRGFNALRSILNESPPEDTLPDLDSLNLFFCHSDFLEKKDLAIIKELGIGSKYQKTQRYPQFRSYVPARYQWYPNDDEAAFLTVAIEQAIEVSHMVKDNFDVLIEGSPDRFLVRTTEDKSGKSRWRNDYKSVGAYQEQPLKRIEIKDSVLKSIKALPKKKNFEIEADLFLSSTPICDSEPPWLPWLSLAIDVKRDFVFPPFFINKDEDPVSRAVINFIDLLSKQEYRPHTITVKNDHFYHSLKDICEKLDCNLTKTNYLPSLHMVKESFKQHMRWDSDL